MYAAISNNGHLHAIAAYYKRPSLLVMNDSGSELQRAPRETRARALKANKACVPCRVRKVKCDAIVIGLPCSSCTSRQCAKDCVLPVRKDRTRKVIHALPIPNHTQAIPATSNNGQIGNANQSNQSERSKQSTQPCTSDPLDCQNPRQTEPDLLYLNILNDAVNETTESSQRHTTSSTPCRLIPEDNFTPRNCLWTKLPHLDDIDNEYLVKKGVFDLPPPRHLDALIKTYFDHVYPFAPVINKADFIRGYQSGDCSLFLLRAILTPASIHTPADVLSACGFASRSAAQKSLFSKAKLLHDFGTEDDPLLMLQGSIVLCMVILDHPSDRDFGFWFHNAIRFATKLDLRNTCIREDKPRKVLKLYRRIWWTLYSLDIFHVSVNTKRLRLFENTSPIKPREEDDWEVEDFPEASSGLLSPATPQQRALPVAHCELFQIFGQCLSIVTNKPQQDPRQIMHPLDAWRKSLATKMHMGENIGTEVHYLSIQAMSYRFECILCRLIRRCWQQSQHTDWSEWVKQRLQSAILELDAIALKVLASGSLQDFPMFFVTTITALLALHIESALDPAETDLVRAMARISISQTMLILTQGKEIPALKRALPVFEQILAKTNLYLVPPSITGQVPAQTQSVTDAYALSHTQAYVVPSQLEQCENNQPLYGDFLGFDFLDDWRLGDWVSLVDVSMASQERAE